MSNNLRAVVSADIKQFTSAMSSVSLSAKATAGLAVAAMTAITAALMGVAAASINAAKSFETQRVRLQLLVGDMAEGAEEFKIIRKLAEGMAFDTETVIDAYIKLRAATGKKFALETIEALGNASFVAGENMSTLADRFGDLVIKARTGGQGMKETVKSLKAVFGEEGIKGIIKAIDEGIAGEDLVSLMEKALSRFGKQAGKEISKTAGGKEDILSGLFKELKASAGSGGALEAYKNILDMLIGFIKELAASQEFKDFTTALGELMSTLATLLATGELQEYFMKAVTAATGLVRVLAIIIDDLHTIAGIIQAIPGLGEAMNAMALAELAGYGKGGKGGGAGGGGGGVAGLGGGGGNGEPIKVVVVDNSGDNVHSTV